MKRATVIVSAVIHAGVAMSLMGAAQHSEKRKAISVAVTDAKKKAQPKPPPPPPPPRPVAHHAPRVVASVPKPAPVVEAPHPAPARAVETALAMSNDDAPGGIALAPKVAAAAAAPTRVASAVSSSRTRRTREALGDGANPGDAPAGGGEAPCTEEPSKPVPVAKTDLEYTVAAKTEGIEGKLKLKLTVAADGSVSDVEVLASVEPALDAVAVAAARQWRFKPAMACGKPVAGGTYVLQKRYELTD